MKLYSKKYGAYQFEDKMLILRDQGKALMKEYLER